MEKLNPNTNKARRLVEAYKQAPQRGLDDCYNACSVYKRRVWRHYLDVCAALHGQGITVVSYNCNFFSLGFLYPDADTGALKLACITPTHDYEIEL